MLLTCAVSSIADLLKPTGRTPPRLTLADVPAYVRDEFDLHGIVLSTDLLVGSTRERLASLRDRADKARCACLALFEPTPLPLGTRSAEDGARHLERLGRVLEAASLLGCNAAGIRVEAADDDDTMDLVAARVRSVMDRAEKLGINLVLNPSSGLTATPDRLTELVKRIGGFRIGTLPDFRAAAAAPDPAHYLKRITPYASVVFATTVEFAEAEHGIDEDKPGSLADLAAFLDAAAEAPPPEHVTYDLRPLVTSIAAVGFDGTLAIEYTGGGDSTLGVLHSKDALRAVIDALAEA